MDEASKSVDPSAAPYAAAPGTLEGGRPLRCFDCAYRRKIVSEFDAVEYFECGLAADVWTEGADCGTRQSQINLFSPACRLFVDRVRRDGAA